MPGIEPRLVERPSPAPLEQEAAFEATPERSPTPVDASGAAPSQDEVASSAAVDAPAPHIATALEQSVEHVLEEGLEDMYRSLSPQDQERFRSKGEQTAGRIAALLQGVKVKVSEILKLIREWLFTIPGLNAFYMEQSAKIKAERVLKLRR